jgi:23S rRNA pseudouridine1911/1915/1917 synthase
VSHRGRRPSRLRVRVPDSASGLRLDRFLAGLPEIASRAAAERILAAGDVFVDGAQAAKSTRLGGGEEIELQPPEAPAPLEAEEVGLEIRYEDEDLFVVDKPAGVVVHPSAGYATGTLVHGVLAHGAAGGEEERPGIVHRLDRDTSGLLVVARSEDAHRRLKNMVRRHELERTYLVLVRGRPRSRAGRIEAPIGRDRRDPTRHSLDTDTPRDAVTHFELVEQLGEYALLRVRLETGRTHQIRVHLAAIGLPVVGDATYGAPDPVLGRQFLHATRLAFTHPFTGDRVDVESPLPAELAGHLEGLR